MAKVISVKNLTKKYGSLIAVNSVSFDVERGEIFGLLGENGAGKTTTLEMIEGLRKPTSGEIAVLDCDIVKHRDAVKERIGVQLQSSAYYQFLTLKEILDLFASFYLKHVSAIELLKMVELESKAKSLIGSLSGGQKQRFSIIASLVNDPEVVFLDEPTTGLDPIARRNLWDLITEIKNKGKTIILTTHYMEEAEILCDRVAIMDSGKILVMDETYKLIKKAEFPFSISFIDKKLAQKVIDELKQFSEVENVFGKESKYTLKIKNQKNMNEALKIIQSINPESLTVGRATLEDLFIELTGKSIGE
ncbi:MAG: ABC transporter ATP-binding protein [Candidatus Berkelbacteria bacterium]|nr:ABC transporter ATP-binding protein [Candidatus Berkelbacteria bacterium]